MTVQTFAVVHGDVRADYFPQMSGFSANSSPSSTRVTGMIVSEGAILAGHLVAKGVTPSALVAGTDAHEWCADTIRLGTAIRVARAMTSMDPEVVKAWAGELRERYKMLDKVGAATLGDESLGNVALSTHISELSLAVDDDGASDAINPFHLGDVL